MPAHRPERLSERIHQDLGVLFAREVSDPRLKDLNVTRVEVTGDLRIAKVFVIPHGDEEADRELMEALKRASGYVRRQLAKSLDLRYAPEVRFYLDRAIEKGERFLQALEQVEAEAEERQAAAKSARKRK